MTLSTVTFLLLGIAALIIGANLLVGGASLDVTNWVRIATA